MKHIAFAAAALLALATPVQASEIDTAARLVRQGNEAANTAAYTIRTTGSLAKSCPHLVRATSYYASSYAVFPHPKTLELMRQAVGVHKRYC